MITTVTKEEAGYLPSAQRFEASTQPISQAAAVAAFEVAGVHAHDVGQFLDAAGTAVRVGRHYAQLLHRRLGLNSSTRARAYLYKTTTEVDAFMTAVTLPTTSWTGQTCRSTWGSASS